MQGAKCRTAGKHGEKKVDEYYRMQLKDGLEFQDYVADLLYKNGIAIGAYSSKKYQIERGENRAGVEIKFDKKFRKTGNFWIEVAEKSKPENPSWIPSGIHRQDNTWLFVIGDRETIYILPKKTLLRLEPGHSLRLNDRKTSRGYLLSVEDAHHYAAKVIEGDG